jgi:hypothetical protein
MAQVQYWVDRVLEHAVHYWLERGWIRELLLTTWKTGSSQIALGLSGPRSCEACDDVMQMMLEGSGLLSPSFTLSLIPETIARLLNLLVSCMTNSALKMEALCSSGYIHQL